MSEISHAWEKLKVIGQYSLFASNMDGMPRLVSNFKLPEILWYQNDGTVVVRIMLVDVDDYFLRIERDHFRFSTTVKGIEYYACFTLYGCVFPDQTYHRNLGREIKVHLHKIQKCHDWLRLSYHSEKNLRIKRDLNHLRDNEWMNCRRFTHKKTMAFSEWREREGLNIMPVVPSSDEEESDDEKLPFAFAD